MSENVIDQVAPVLSPEPVVAPVVQPESGAPQEKQITMSQSKLDELIKGRQSAALKKAAALEKENTRLKEIAAGAAPDASELERVRAELSARTLETDRLREESAAAKKTAFILGQAAQNRVLDKATDVVVTMTKNNLRWNNEKKGYDVLNDAGDIQDTTPEKFFQEFLNSRLYLVKGEVVPGIGSSGSNASASAVPRDLGWAHYIGPNSNSRDANALAQRDPRKYQEYKRQARAAGAIS